MNTAAQSLRVLVGLGLLVLSGCGRDLPQPIIVERPLDSPDRALARLVTAANAEDLDSFQQTFDARSRESFARILADAIEVNRARRDADFEFEKALDEAFGVDLSDEFRTYILTQAHADLLRDWKQVLPQLAAKAEILERTEESPECIRLRLRFWGRLYEGAPLHENGERPARAIKEQEEWKLDIPWFVKSDPQEMARQAERLREELRVNQWFVGKVKSKTFKNRRQAREMLSEGRRELRKWHDPKLISGAEKGTDGKK